MTRVHVAASVLTADFANLYRVVRKLEHAGVDRLHLDVMDGHFVPNLTFGPTVVAAFRRLTALPLDLHLMISRPSRYVPAFIDAGGDTVTFHVEADESRDVKREALAQIADAGRVPGLAVSPETGIEAIDSYLDLLGIVMVMTVRPGFGGQRFLPEQAPKIAAARERLRDAGRTPNVHVDGGVSRETAEEVGRFGVDVCVVGSALFQRGKDAADEVRQVRRRAESARDAEAAEHSGEARAHAVSMR